MSPRHKGVSVGRRAGARYAFQFWVWAMTGLLAAPVGGAMVGKAWAQSAPQPQPPQPQPSPGDINQLLQQQQHILQEEEQRRRDRLDRLRASSPPQEQQAPQQAQPAGAAAKHCVPVHKIVFSGAELLPEETKASLRQPFAGKCMSIVDIMAVVRVATNWYVDQGYVTTRIYPPQQDLSKGVLTLKVVEGRVQRVDIYENGKPREAPNMAFPSLEGERLYIRDVEQGLDQINRMPTHDATIRIEQGDREGYSRLRVEDKKTVLPIVTSTIDNSGLKSTGTWQAGTTIYMDDVLGLYDAWALSYKTSNIFYDGYMGSEEFSGSVSLPYGYWTLLLSGSYFDYRSTLRGQTQSFRSDGVSRYYMAELERLLHRDQDSKTRLSAFINFKDTENFIEDIRLITGSRKLNILGGRLSHTRRFLDGRLDASLSAQFGVPMFGSLTDADSLPGSPIAEFSKGTGDINYFRPFMVGPLNFALSVKGSGQWSDDKLYSTEQLCLGGLYTVRGFKERSLCGDSGGFVRNELIWSIPPFLPDPLKRVFGAPSLFAGYDQGWLRPDSNDPFERGTVAGFVTGARMSGGPLFAEAAYEKPLAAPSYIPKYDLFRFQAGVSLRW